MIGEHAVGNINDSKKALVRLSLLVSLPIFALGFNLLIDIVHVSELGDDELIANQMSLPFYWIMMAGVTAFSAYVSSNIRRRLDEGRKDDAEKFISNAMYLGIAAFILLAFFATLAFMFIYGSYVDEKIDELSSSYLLPFFIMFFAFPSYAIVIGLLSAEGSYKRYTAVVIATVASNIILDYVFVHGLHMGIFGNGLGTIMGIYIGALVGLAFYRRKTGALTIELYKPNIGKIYQMGKQFARKQIVPLVEVGMEYVAVFAIVVFYSVTDAIYFTIPMHIATVFASMATAIGMSATLISKRLKDEDSKVVLWIHQYKYAFLVSIFLAIVSYMLSDILFDVLLHTEMKDWHKPIMTSMIILFSATIPFIGLRQMNKYTMESLERDRDMFLVIVGSVGVRLLTFVIAIQFLPYPYIFYIIVADYIIVGSAGAIGIWLLQKYRRDYIFGILRRGHIDP